MLFMKEVRFKLMLRLKRKRERFWLTILIHRSSSDEIGTGTVLEAISNQISLEYCNFIFIAIEQYGFVVLANSLLEQSSLFNKKYRYTHNN